MKKMVNILTASIVIILLLTSGIAISNKGDDYVAKVYNNEGNNESVSIPSLDEYSETNEIYEIKKQAIVAYIEENNLLENIYNFDVSYNAKLKSHFSDLIDDSELFDEELFVSELRGKMYKIDSNGNNPILSSLGLTYDYSSYIRQELDFYIYLEMLKELYILEEFNELIDNSNIRLFSSYSDNDLDFIENLLENLESNKYETIADINDILKKEEKEELGRQLCINLGYSNEYYEDECSATTSSSTYDSALSKFTTCKDGLWCTIEEGFEYQISLVDNTDYIKREILSDDYLNIKVDNDFMDNINEYNIYYSFDNREEKYLVNPLYKYSDIREVKDLIHRDTSTKDFYFISVKEVNMNNISNALITDSEIEFVLDKLTSRISDEYIIKHYISDIDIDISEFVNDDVSVNYNIGEMILLSKADLKEKLINKDDFVLVVGSEKNSYLPRHVNIIDRYIELGNIVYYVDVAVIAELQYEYVLFDNIPLDRGVRFGILATPMTIYVEDGEFKDALLGSVESLQGDTMYHRFFKFMKGEYVNKSYEELIVG